MRDLSKEAAFFIKNKARAKGISQAQLAQSLNVSLPTIKRWFGGGTLTIQSLQQLSAEIGISLTEIFSSIEESSTQGFAYTNEQELFFSNSLEYLAFFDNLLRGHSPAKIQKKFKINDKKLVMYLSKLDKLKLIEWLPKNKVKLLVNGEPIWRKDGLLSKKLRNDIFKDFLDIEDKSKSHFYLHDYTDEDRVELERKITDLLDFARRANARAKSKIEVAKSAGIYLSLQNFRWSVDKFLSS